MRAFIFSNCKKSDNETFVKAMTNQITTDDTLIFLNKGLTYYPNAQAFKRYPNKHIILRSYRFCGLPQYFGMESLPYFNAPKDFKSVILFDHDLEVLKIKSCDMSARTSEDVNISNVWLKNYIQTTKKIPTTGFAAYFLVKEILGISDITLVNFYGSKDNSTGKCPEHDWQYEEEFISRHMKKIFA